MNKAQKEVQQAFLDSEEAVLQQLNTVYQQAKLDIETKIFELYSRKDVENLQTIIYQLDYQKAIKKQIDSILDDLNSGQFKTVSEYLTKCYEEGFLGTMYDLKSQGIPLIIPLDQKAVVRAVTLDSKINGSMYSHFGENVTALKQDISREISRGISTGISWAQTAKHITQNMMGSYDNPKGSFAYAMRIARTEGHRIQIQSAMDAQQKAKDAGADIVKQWDSALDGRTRPDHQKLDGQIRELDEDFEVNGKHAAAPGMFGDPSEDCNCRCALLQRAKWALDQEELDALKERAEYFELDKTKDFADFKQKYLKAAENGGKIEPKKESKEVNLGGLKDYPKTHHKAITKFIEDAPEECRKAWNDCADDFHVLARRKGEKGAYYSPSRDGVSLAISSAKKGSSYQTPYQVVFHEYGHHMDYIFNRKYGTGDRMKAFSETYKGGIFGQTLKAEANKAIEDFAKANGLMQTPNRGALIVKADKMVNRGLLEPGEKIQWIKEHENVIEIDRLAAEKAFCKHIKESLELIDRTDISDMFEPVMDSSNAYPFGVGHGSRYWTGRDNGKEGFAEMYSAKVNNPGSWEQIKKFFPDSVAIFEEMLKVVE